MSIRTSKVWLFIAALIVTGCGDLSGLGGTRSAPKSVTLSDGYVVVGERGWCVDKRTTRSRDDVSVVVFGSCAALSRNAFAPRPPIEGVLMVSVQAGQMPDTRSLAGFFETDLGRSRLSHDGKAKEAKLLYSDVSGGALLLQIEDAGLRGRFKGSSTTYWRALLGHAGRMVSISVIPKAPISKAEGRALLERQIGVLKRGNSGA